MNPPSTFLHLLAKGSTPGQIANNKGHLFEKLMRDLFASMKVEITHLNKSESGLEIDIEGIMKLGRAKVFAECKAKSDPLDSTDIQKFGFKYMDKKHDEQDVRGFLLSMSGLNPKAQELWDSKLKGKHGDGVSLILHNEILKMLIEHYSIVKPETIRHNAEIQFARSCGDTQLLCFEGSHQLPELLWAQLLMSIDGTEPNYLIVFNTDGDIVENRELIREILNLKPDLSTSKLTCLNLEEQPTDPPSFDDVTPARTVVRVRMSSDWFDYRFPAAPEFFVGRDVQLLELERFVAALWNGKTTSRGILVTGRSGIGKSSLILKARETLMADNVLVLPIDSRLCDDIGFIFDTANELLFELRQDESLADDLAQVRVHGLDSLIETYAEINKILIDRDILSIIFFDQFEKVFEFPEVAKSLRSLFLRIMERQLNIVFGFAWKSDLWSLAEGFPHAERDDLVRESFHVSQLEQFGQDETREILSQLEIKWGSKLNQQLYRQLATFSRGLPWLLNKLCSHLLDQKNSGVSEQELIETNLKLQDLFESDLAGLDDEERTLIKAIAPMLPATLRRLSESFEIANIDQSLHRFIDKRILVKITEDVQGSFANVKYDAYSDIFREFLITGNVPLEDAYYYFSYPKGALTFFEKVRERGSISIEEERSETGKQVGSIYNLSRDLRSLGLVNVSDKIFTIPEDVKGFDQISLREFLQTQLKKNRVVSLTLAELNEHGKLPIDEIAILLKEMFPSVQAKDTTWDFYSKIIASWLHEARLALHQTRTRLLYQVEDEEVFERVVSRRALFLEGYRFPVCFRNAIIECLMAMKSSRSDSPSVTILAQKLEKSQQSIEKALSDNIKLGFVEHGSDPSTYSITELGYRFVKANESDRRNIFRESAIEVEVFRRFVSRVEESGGKGVTPFNAASDVLREFGVADLTNATIEKLGAMLANWADYSGLISRQGRRSFLSKYVPQQITLFN